MKKIFGLVVTIMLCGGGIVSAQDNTNGNTNMTMNQNSSNHNMSNGNMSNGNMGRRTRTRTRRGATRGRGKKTGIRKTTNTSTGGNMNQ